MVKTIGGYFGMVFFGLGTCVLLRRLFVRSDSLITISPEGIRDARIAPAVIRWRVVTNISTWRYRRQRIMVLTVRPTAEKELGLTNFMRWTRGINRTLGVDGLPISTTGLKIDYDTLLQTTLAYARAYNPQIPLTT